MPYYEARLLMTLPVQLVPRLLQLGFFVSSAANGSEYIAPPLCDVPAGGFLFGSDPINDTGAYDNELPQHSMGLTAYKIARYPVTVAEYACFVRAGQQEPDNWQQQLGKPDHPVAHISWYDAVAYAQWLSACAGQPWRLPSEAEWEKATRGTDGRIYPWDDTFRRTRCNTSEGKRGGTTPVGSYPKGVSPYGALDMIGNVWEWTNSIIRPYPYDASDGREATESLEHRVLRGGSWDFSAWEARAAFRFDFHPGAALDDFGFRLVLAPSVS
jgi:formylglycine-generating enzyme required for sulfatase activity